MLTVAEERLHRLAAETGKAVSIHLYGQEVQPETRSAHEDQVRAGVRQRNHAGLVLEQAGDALVTHVEEVADERGLQVLFKAQVQQDVQRIATASERSSSC